MGGAVGQRGQLPPKRRRAYCRCFFPTHIPVANMLQDFTVLNDMNVPFGNIFILPNIFYILFIFYYFIIYLFYFLMVLFTERQKNER